MLFARRAALPRHADARCVSSAHRESLKWLWNGSGMNRTRRTKRPAQGPGAEVIRIAVYLFGGECRRVLLLASSECYYLVVRRQIRIVMRLNEVHHTNLALRLGCPFPFLHIVTRLRSNRRGF